MIRIPGRQVSILSLTALLLATVASGAAALPATGEVAQAEEACTGSDCPPKDESTSASADKPKPKVKTIKEFVKDKTRIEGLFPMYQDKESGAVFLELSPDQLDREYIYYTFVKSGTGGLLGMLSGLRTAGDIKDNYVVKFRRHFNEVDIVRQNTDYVFDAGTPLARAQGVNNPDAVMAVLNVVAEDKDEPGKRVIVAASALFEGTDLFRLGDASPLLKALGVTPTLSKKKTSVRSVHNYPDNSAVVAEYVFDFKMGPNPASVFVQHNFTRMPEDGFAARLDDPRVGYFTERKTNLSSVEGLPYEDKIRRWRLEKADPKAAVSKPKKPITYWIQNTTPLEYRETIRHAALQWNKVFEAAGFRDAIEVKIQPDDADWDAGDIRYNVIQWIASPSPLYNGYGPSVVNPRTGEIISANIVIEQANIRRQLLLDDIFLGGATADSDGAVEASDECRAAAQSRLSLGFAQAMLMAGATALAPGQTEEGLRKIIRDNLTYLVMHEMGHTFGLTHNMKASYYRSIEELQGALPAGEPITGSVMDYPAANILPNSNGVEPVYPNVPGPYDYWAIEFGYSPAMNVDAVRNRHLARAGEPGLLFGNDSEDMRTVGRGIDPRVIPYDMSNEPLTFAKIQMDMIRDAQHRLRERVLSPNETYDNLLRAHELLSSIYARHGQAISRFVGGVYVDRGIVGGMVENRVPLTPVSGEDQRRAMALLNQYFFAPDAFSYPEGYFAYLLEQRRGQSGVDVPAIHADVWSMQSKVLDHLLNPATLQRMADSTSYGNSYGVSAMLHDLSGAIFAADAGGKANSFRQSLQVKYVRRLIDVYENKDVRYDLARPIVYAELSSVRSNARKREKRGDSGTRAARQYIAQLVDDAFNRFARR